MKISTYHLFFMNLANPLKISIVTSLKQKPKSVSELSQELNVEQSKISHALKSLKSCNILSLKQSGKKHFYYLNKETIIPMLNLIDKHSKNFCKGGCSLKCKLCGGK